MRHNQIFTSEESCGHLRGVTKLLLGGVLKARFQRGQSLIEVIIAATVGILVVTALTFATIFSLRNASFAKNSEQATKLAQEGIERVRTGRDRNAGINNLPNVANCPSIYSWNGDTATSNRNPIWSCRIYATCGNGLNNCYFRFNPNPLYPNNLNYFTSNSSFPPSGAEEIPPMFKRVIILSDDAATFPTQKKVTVIVRWSDFAGAHESKLTTYLRKL